MWYRQVILSPFHVPATRSSSPTVPTLVLLSAGVFDYLYQEFELLLLYLDLRRACGASFLQARGRVPSLPWPAAVHWPQGSGLFFSTGTRRLTDRTLCGEFNWCNVFFVFAPQPVFGSWSVGCHVESVPFAELLYVL